MNDADEMFRDYMARQADRQTRALNKISDDTGVIKAAAIVVLILAALIVLFALMGLLIS